LRQRSAVLRWNKPQEFLEKKGMHWNSSTWVNLLSSMKKNEMIPLFMDFPYLEPIDEVFRLEELKFNSYPQIPQLHQSSFNFLRLKNKAHAETTKSTTIQ
jgi:hypothetical protein